MFKPVDSKVDFPALEREVLDWWRVNGVVEKYLSANDDSDQRFSFIDGPITANNPMGVHHAWGRTYKDLYQRYKTMRGYRQRYQNGFDGQGLWIEVEVEKELGFKSKRDIEAYGIDKFVDLCKERVRKFSQIQTEQSVRLGYWMDWDNSYHTMSDENNYTIWHFLKRCHDRGWLYQGTDVMPWCPRCGTGLSEHEIVTEGYQEVVHPGLYIRFPIKERPGESLLVWTTTPWTLTANTAAAVHPELTYLKVRVRAADEGDDSEVLYLSKALRSLVRGEHEVLQELPGRDLVGLHYDGPFDELPAQEGVEHTVIAWYEVSESEGTGIVHIAPGAGKEDFALGKDEGLSTIAPLDEFGDYVDGFDWLTGRNVYEVNDAIYDSLKGKGVFYHLESYSHRYPFCWRCNSELVFRLVDEWFISMGELRESIAAVTRKIRWIPSFGLGRELDWLKNMDDWMISKKRYWGLALPIYRCECGHFDVIGSEDELKSRATEGWEDFEGHSPHRPWVDAVKIECTECGSPVSRIRDVGNPWLDAGIVPFSTLGYRHDREGWQNWFPADWISESFPGQFRNWFYSLLTMSTVLENQEPFRTVFSYALMRDEKGEEMHKSKGNAIWFEEAAEEMGVDSMRWLYMHHNPASNLNFGYGAATDVRRRFLIPLWNVYSFFVTYANIDGYDPANATAPAMERRSELDRWIVSELNSLVSGVTGALEEYECEDAARKIEDFVDYLSNWYVRRSRRRFWKSGVLNPTSGAVDEDKLSAYATLYECLTTLVKLTAPFIPFVTESMYQNLVRSADLGQESVHLDSWPVPDASKVDETLAEATRLAMRVSSLGRAARSKAGIKVRQPLATALVKLKTRDEAGLLTQVRDQVLEELNLKALDVLEDESDVTVYKVQPNLPLLGPKYGPRVAEIQIGLAAKDPRQVYSIVVLDMAVEVEGFVLEPEEVIVSSVDRPGYSGASEGGYTVAISTVVSPELASEGLARELVHRLQNMRRSAGFDIADHIVTYYDVPADLKEVFDSHSEYILQETLSDRLVEAAAPEGTYGETHEIDGHAVQLGVERV